MRMSEVGVCGPLWGHRAHHIALVHGDRLCRPFDE
jgi:hypothetical protein